MEDEGYWTRAGRLTRRRLLGGAGAAGIGVALAACGGGNSTKNTANTAAKATSSSGAPATSAAAGAKAVRGGSMTVAIASDIANLDPLKSSLYVDRLIHYQMYDSLVRTDKDLKLNPGLALSWETSDPLNIVFKLRQGVTFHDGTDFNADAVKFNLERILATPSSPRRSEVVGLDSVQVIDPTTVKFVMKAPFSPLLAQLVDRAGMILSPAAIQKLGDNLTHAPTGAGSGAFKFVDYVKSDHLGLIRNESYWDKDSSGGALPYLDKLTYRFVVDSTQRLNSLKTGEIDFSDGIPPKDVESVKKDPSLTYVQIPALSYAGVDLHSAAPVFKDVRVRQALAWSIDRQQIVDNVLFKIPTVAYGPIAPPMFPYDPTFKPYTRDVNKAKALLQQAGTPSVSFTMLITAGDPVTEQLASLIKDEAQEAGITINLQSLDFPTLNGLTIKHQYEAALEGWSGRLDPDGNTYSQLHTGGGFNDGEYSNPVMDKALDDARATFDQAQRKALYQQVNKLAADDVPYVWYDFGTTGQYSTNKVKNFTPVPDAIYRFYNVWKTA
jgi:peptide/nickel transport system substrate-binding protein